jgi:hypothetical protein
MHVNSRGEGIAVERIVELDDDTIERMRDAVLVQLVKQNAPYHRIARFFGKSPAWVCRRLRRIPERARRHFEEIPLDGLGRAG